MKYSIASDTAEMSYMEQGKQIEIFARIKNDKKGLYKAWIAGEQGKMVIGTFIPEGETLQIRRTISVGRLQSVGCYPITKGGATLVHSFDTKQITYGWNAHDKVESLFEKDEILRKAANDLQGCLIRRTSSGFQLAVPYHTRKPFPFTPVFCFSTITHMQGKYYVLFTFDENQKPII